MTAQQLIVEQCKDYTFATQRLQELIDAHNALVRHVFGSPAETVLQPTPTLERNYIGMNEKPKLKTKIPTVEEIRFAHNLLIAWGRTCIHVFNKTFEPLTGIIKCKMCGLPVIPNGD